MSENPEDLFPPKAGGMVDSARRKAQADSDQLDAHNASLSPDDARPKYPVPVFKIDEPDAYTAKTPIVQTGGKFAVIQLLGRDEDRKRAVIIALDEPIVVAVSVSQANDPNIAAAGAGLPTSGFTLPVNIPHVVYGSAEIWVGATSGTATRVSVWAEKFREGENA